jgi:hypothetical protein
VVALKFPQGSMSEYGARPTGRADNSYERSDLVSRNPARRKDWRTDTSSQCERIGSLGLSSDGLPLDDVEAIFVEEQ